AALNYDSPTHAFIWHGTAASAVDINSSAYFESRALGIWEDEIVGDGMKIGGSHFYGEALLWDRSTSKLVVLTPEPAKLSQVSQVQGASAKGVFGNEQVGAVITDTGHHA